MEQNELKVGTREISIGILIAILLFSFMVYGTSGTKVVLTVLVLFFLPFFLILNNFDFTLGEKIMFAFFMSMGTYSTLVYWIGFITGSLKVSAIVSALLLIGIAYLIKAVKRKHSKV